MRRYRTSYRPQLERLEDWFAPNNLFALSDLGLADLPVPSTWVQPGRTLRLTLPVFSEETAETSGATVTFLGAGSSQFDEAVPVSSHLEHPQQTLGTPRDALYLLNLPPDGFDRPAGPGSQGDCPNVTWNAWSGPPEASYNVGFSPYLPEETIIAHPWSLTTTSIQVAAPNYPEYPYNQDVDWTGWTTEYCDHITEYYSPGVYGVRVNTINPPNTPFFLAIQASDGASDGGRQQKVVGAQVRINEGAAHVFIASDSWGMSPNTRMIIQAIAQERGIPFSVADNIQNFKAQIDARWRANGMMPIDVFLAGGGSLPGGDVSIGAQFMWFRFANWDQSQHITELGLNPNSAKGKVRSLTIFANYLTRDFQPGMDHHAIKLLAQALDDGVTVNPRVGGWTGAVFAVRPDGNRPGHFTSTEGSNFHSVLAR